MRKPSLLFLLLPAALMLAVIPSCGNRAERAAPGKLPLIASIFPLADWLREVGGDDVQVTCLVDGGQNPHHFEPSVNDATRVTRAKAMFVVGLGLDPWAQKLADNSGGDVKVFSTGDWISAQKMGATREIEIKTKDGKAEEDDDRNLDRDPHYWLDPARALIVVKKMGEELSALDPAHTDAYQKRAGAYAAKLTELNAGVDKLAAQVPAGLQMVTFHDAYGYLFARLKIKIAAVVQVSPGVEPSARDVAEAVKFMKSLNQKVVFQEPGANITALQALATELNARVELLDPMDTGVSDAGTTYVERLSHDLKIIAGAAGIKP